MYTTHERDIVFSRLEQILAQNGGKSATMFSAYTSNMCFMPLPSGVAAALVFWMARAPRVPQGLDSCSFISIQLRIANSSRLHYGTWLLWALLHLCMCTAWTEKRIQYSSLVNHEK